jgi:hypothetical protein
MHAVWRSPWVMTRGKRQNAMGSGPPGAYGAPPTLKQGGVSWVLYVVGLAVGMNVEGRP